MRIPGPTHELTLLLLVFNSRLLNRVCDPTMTIMIVKILFF